MAVGSHRPIMRVIVNEMRSRASSEGQWEIMCESRVIVSWSFQWSFVDHLGLSGLLVLP